MRNELWEIACFFAEGEKYNYTMKLIAVVDFKEWNGLIINVTKYTKVFFLIERNIYMLNSKNENP